MFQPFIGSIAIVGGTYSPFVLGQIATDNFNPMDLLLQTPILGILVVVVFLFLKHMREAEERRAETSKVAEEHRLRAIEIAETARSEAIKHLGDDCHLVQRESIKVMEKVTEKMASEAEVRGRTLQVIERLEKKLADI